MLIFGDDMKGQRVAYTTQVTFFENILRIRRFIYPNVFGRRVVETNDLRWSVVLLVKPCIKELFFAFNFA